MNGKSWCDICAGYCRGVHIYDAQCLACGKLETLTACKSGRQSVRFSELSKCSRCRRLTPRKVCRSLFPERELRR